MKVDSVLIGVVFMVMAYAIWDQQARNSDSALENRKLLEDNAVIDSLYRSHSQINIRILNVISEREQAKLQKDSIYMSLTDKIN